MCNRYAFIADAAMMNLLRQLGLANASPKSRYNIAPTNLVPAIRAYPGGHQLETMRWGFISAAARSEAKPTGFTNARAETVAEKPSFRQSFKFRRCLIPASGFFEWKHTGKTKQPYYIYRTDEKPMLFAGIHESWTTPDDRLIETCAIITAEPNELMSPIHDRMPVILPVELVSQWLDPDNQDPDALRLLLKPFPAALMNAHPVSSQVGSPVHQGSELIKPVASTGLPFLN